MSRITFKPEEAVASRTEARQRDKRLKKGSVWYECPSCGAVELGGKVAYLLINKDSNTGKETVIGRQHRRCHNCGINMLRRVKK